MNNDYGPILYGHPLRNPVFAIYSKKNFYCLFLQNFVSLQVTELLIGLTVSNASNFIEMSGEPNDKILDITKLKALEDDILNVAEMTISLFNRVENTGKRRKYWLPAFSPFPTEFSEALFLRVFESQDCLVKS